MSMTSNASAHTCPVGASGRHAEKVVQRAHTRDAKRIVTSALKSALVRRRGSMNRSRHSTRSATTPNKRSEHCSVVRDAMRSRRRVACGSGVMQATRSRQPFLALWMRRRHRSASPLKKAAAGHLLEWPWPDEAASAKSCPEEGRPAIASAVAGWGPRGGVPGYQSTTPHRCKQG